MTAGPLLLGAVAVAGAGVVLAVLAVRRLVRLTSRPEGTAATAGAVVSLLAAVGLAGAGVATTGALLLGPAAPAPADVPETPASPPARIDFPESRGGRAIRSDAARLGAPLEIAWPVPGLHVRVPADWIVVALTATALEVRDPRTDIVVTGHVTPMPAGPTFDEYWTAHVAHARDRLAARIVDGYATRRVGAVPGVLVLEPRDDGRTRRITWTGFQPAALGSLAVTLAATASADDFARDEPLLGAIFESISFE